MAPMTFTINSFTPTAGQTAAAPTSILTVTGTFNGCRILPQISDDGTNWAPVSPDPMNHNFGNVPYSFPLTIPAGWDIRFVAYDGGKGIVPAARAAVE